MKKNTKLTFIILLIIFSLIGCKNPLLDDPRIYNQQQNNQDNKDDSESESEFPELDLNEDNGITPFDNKDAWYNNPSCNGDETTPSKVGFDATDFDNLALTSWFNKSNVPQYEFEYSDVWTKVANTSSNQFEYNGPDTVSLAESKNSGFPVTNVYYYYNKGYNPLYKAEYNAKLSKTTKGAPRLERFNFYSFKGNCVGQNLDNYLIAIDTYSKFIFAFAKPIGFIDIIGNKMPTGWGVIDEKSKRFYEYDPIGYVEKTDDGNYVIEIYEWFENNLANNDYKAYKHPNYAYVAKKSPDGAGSSPFYVEVASTSFKDNVKETSYSYREADGYIGTDGKGYGKTLYTLSFNSDGTVLEFYKTVWGKQKEKIEEANHVREDNLQSAVYKKKDGTELIINLSKDLKSITVNNINYFKDFELYEDLGPAFTNRIEPNINFKPFLSQNTYKFNEFNDLVYESKKDKLTYKFIENHERSLEFAQAIYQDSDGKYWGVKIGKDGNKLSLTNLSNSKENIDWTKWIYNANKQKIN